MKKQLDWVTIIAIVALIFAAICLAHITSGLLSQLLWIGVPIITCLLIVYLLFTPSNNRRSF
ncbi:MAG: hypothetical protein ACTJHC_01450 [Vagococcus sp.]